MVYAWWFPISASYTWHVDWVDQASFDPLTPANAWREDPSGFDRIVEWLRGFMAENHVAAAWFENGALTASGNPLAGEVGRMAPKDVDGLLVRSWRGTHDVGRTPELPPPVVVAAYGDPESRLGRLVAESLEGEVDLRFATEPDLPDTDRAILLDPEWNLALMPSPTHFASSDGRRWTVRPEEQAHRRLFAVRWDGEEWTGLWEEEASFDVRVPDGDRELLRRHLLAWLREP